MTMQIRRYQGSDHDQVLCLHRVALAAIGADAGPGPWDDDLEQIEQSYLTVRGDFLVGILDDRVAAMGALRHIDQQTAELKRMRVSPSLNNKGLGRRILHALEARARELRLYRRGPGHQRPADGRHRLYRTEGYLETRRGELADPRRGHRTPPKRVVVAAAPR